MKDWSALRLRDRIEPDLRVLFVGINPGVRSALTGHHFAGFSNRFWKLVVDSGLVPEPITYTDDHRLLEWGLGITNLIARPTPGINDLRGAEYVEGWKILDKKIARYRPAVVALVGVTLYRAIVPLLGVSRQAQLPEEAGRSTGISRRLAPARHPWREAVRAAEPKRPKCQLQLRRDARRLSRAGSIHRRQLPTYSVSGSVSIHHSHVRACRPSLATPRPGERWDKTTKRGFTRICRGRARRPRPARGGQEPGSLTSRRSRAGRFVSDPGSCPHPRAARARPLAARRSDARPVAPIRGNRR